MNKVTTSASRDITVERYDNPDFAAILRETTVSVSKDAEGKETRHSSRRVKSSPDASHADYCKAIVLAMARYGSLMELPYTIEDISAPRDDTECVCLTCNTYWHERKIATPLRNHMCPNGHIGNVIKTGAEGTACPEKWYYSLSDDNPPGKVSFRKGKEGYPAFRELVMPLNFRKYDGAKADEIRARYSGAAHTKRTEVDPDLMIMGELGELDGKATA